jgi:hypothetical protein
MREHDGALSELMLHTSDDGLAHVQLWAVDGSVTLTQAQLAESLQTTTQAMTQPIAAIYAEGELSESQGTSTEGKE